MKKWLILLVLIPFFAVHAKTKLTFTQDVRKLTGDNVAPFVVNDTTIHYFIDEAVAWVGVMGLAVTYIDTIPMTDGTLVYYLTPNDTSTIPLEIQVAFSLNNAGKMQGVPRIKQDDFWLKPQDESGYMLIDTGLVVTDKLSEEPKLVVWFTGEPRVLVAMGDITVCNIPSALSAVVAYQAAGYALMSTRTEPNLSIGAGYLTLSNTLMKQWVGIHRMKPSDSLGIIR